MNKSEYACRDTISALPGDLRLWTFTLRHCIEPKIATKAWRRLLDHHLKPLGFAGVRVFETHPGGHGLHVHFVCNKFISVNRVRHAVAGSLFGRIHVCQIDKKSAGYVAKYLTKSRRSGLLKGVRLWATVGLPRAFATRTIDVCIVCARSELYHELTKTMRSDDPIDRLRIMERAANLYQLISPERLELLSGRAMLRTAQSMRDQLFDTHNDHKANVQAEIENLTAAAQKLGVQQPQRIEAFDGF